MLFNLYSKTFTKNNIDSYKRFAFIDGLRAIAALWVLCFHFYNGSPIEESLSQIFPTALCILFENGNLGVEVFFVISGFVMAYSLRNAKINLKFLKLFTIRRFLRLAPPYYLIIVLTIISNLASNLVFQKNIAPIPNFREITAHLFYLQDILQVKPILVVFWTLCIEVQFYFVFVILLSIAQVFERRAKYKTKTIYLLLFTPLFCLSIVTNIFSIQYPISGLFINHWYIFFLGILVYWVAEKKISSLNIFANALLLILLILIKPSIGAITVVMVAAIILFTYQTQYIYTWLNNSLVQYLGKISYSLYLSHALIGTKIITVGYESDSTPLFTLGLFIVATIVSILSAGIIYSFVEQPSIYLTQKLKKIHTTKLC